MSRLLILGVSPLPFETTDRSFGPGTRTWQITEPLLDDGHEVHLVAMRIPKTYPDDAPPEIVRQDGRLTYASVTDELYYRSSYVREVYAELRPDAVVFAHGSASYDDGLMDPEVPDLDRPLRPRDGRGAGQGGGLPRRLLPRVLPRPGDGCGVPRRPVLHRLRRAEVGPDRRARSGRPAQLHDQRSQPGPHHPVRGGGAGLPARAHGPARGRRRAGGVRRPVERGLQHLDRRRHHVQRPGLRHGAGRVDPVRRHRRSDRRSRRGHLPPFRRDGPLLPAPEPVRAQGVAAEATWCRTTTSRPTSASTARRTSTRSASAPSTGSSTGRGPPCRSSRPASPS